MTVSLSAKARRNRGLPGLAMALCLGSGLALASAATPAAASVVVYDFVGNCAGCGGMGLGEIVLRDATPGQALTMANIVSFSFSTNFGQVLISPSQITAFEALLDSTNLADSHVMVDENGQIIESTGSGFWFVQSSLNGGDGGGGGGGGGSRQGFDQTSGDPPPPPPPQFGFFDGADIESISIQTADEGLPAVPEPTTWALMIGGFAGVGGLLRDRRRRAPRLDVA